jgi:hypothetical protein
MAFEVGYCIPAHDSASYSATHGLIIGKFVFAGLVDSLIDFSLPNGTNNYEDLTGTYMAYAKANSTVICGIRDSLGYGSAQVYIDFNDDQIFEASESVGGNQEALTICSPALHRENDELVQGREPPSGGSGPAGGDSLRRGF